MFCFRVALTLLLPCAIIVSSSAETNRTIVVVDERWVCGVKKSCTDCLRLSHCSWCGTENKCFSKSLPAFEGFCKDNITENNDIGLSSAEENVMCACGVEPGEQRCRPPFAAEEAECSGRGKCLCGRCVCDPLPDPEHPTKTVMGEYCEFDNFSCDGPRCNEGPYSLIQPRNANDEESEKNVATTSK